MESNPEMTACLLQKTSAVAIWSDGAAPMSVCPRRYSCPQCSLSETNGIKHFFLAIVSQTK
jgi:nitrate reductase cytochrome c-type subunit